MHKGLSPKDLSFVGKAQVSTWALSRVGWVNRGVGVGVFQAGPGARQQDFEERLLCRHDCRPKVSPGKSQRRCVLWVGLVPAELRGTFKS